MKPYPAKYIVIGFVLACATRSALAAEMTAAAVNSAEPSKQILSNEKPTPAGVRLQVLLDRAHFSPGEIDGDIAPVVAFLASDDARWITGETIVVSGGM